MTDLVELIEEDHDDDDHDRGEETEYDEHIWTSPKNAIMISKGIADVLCEVSPENAQKYIRFIEEYTGTDLCLVSVSPERDANIILKELI